MIKIPTTLKKLVSISNFRRLLVYTLVTTCAFYFGSFDYTIFNTKNVQDIFQNYILLKFIGLSIIIHLVFYSFVEILLRLLFHGYTRDKFLKLRAELIRQGWYKYLRDMHGLYTVFKLIFRDYVYRLGFFTKKDITGNVEITETDKEELLNEILADCYKWICVVIHFLFTLFFIWKYLGLWVILGAIVILFFLFLFPIGAIILVMNIDLLNKVRLDILKSKTI